MCKNVCMHVCMYICVFFLFFYQHTPLLQLIILHKLFHEYFNWLKPIFYKLHRRNPTIIHYGTWKRPSKRPRRRWEDNIRMDFKGIGIGLFRLRIETTGEPLWMQRWTSGFYIRRSLKRSFVKHLKQKVKKYLNDFIFKIFKLVTFLQNHKFYLNSDTLICVHWLKVAVC